MLYNLQHYACMCLIISHNIVIMQLLLLAAQQMELGAILLVIDS